MKQPKALRIINNRLKAWQKIKVGVMKTRTQWHDEHLNYCNAAIHELKILKVLIWGKGK